MAYKVCLFGDSVGKGVILDSEHKYRPIRDCYANLISTVRPVAVENFSHFGWTMRKCLGILERHLGEVSGYDRTVLEFGGNDSDYDWAAIAADPDGRHEPHTPIGEFSAGYEQALRDVIAAGGRPIALNLPPCDPRKYFKWISKNLNAENILKWLYCGPEYIYVGQEVYSIAIQNAVERVPGAAMIDIRTPFLQRHDYTKLLCDDGIHPNEEGHRLICRTIADAPLWPAAV